jgi:hypothetical protein
MLSNKRKALAFIVQTNKSSVGLNKFALKNGLSLQAE